MKAIKIFLLLVFISKSAYSQDYFQTAVEYYQKGKYAIADTFFTRHLKQFPNDRDALYNRAVIKLIFRDTCSFCKDLFAIINPWEVDKEALNKYFSLCGSTDTICFYDKKFGVTNKIDCRYFEVIEHHKYYDAVIGKIHDKKHKYQVTSISLTKIEGFTSDIIARYELTSDSCKIYSIASSPPIFPGGPEKYRETIDRSSALQQMKGDLNIPGTVVFYDFIIDKMGKAKDFKIKKTLPKIDNTDEILKKIAQLYNDMPNFIPGKFRDKPVDFSMLYSITL